jgi:hypothetical protein
MRLRTAGLVVAAVAAVALPVQRADAQLRPGEKPLVEITINERGERVVRTYPRPQITVTRRSFLDAGTEVLPGERKFTDYAFPIGPGSSPYAVLGPGETFVRRPLPDPGYLPGYGWYR